MLIAAPIRVVILILIHVNENAQPIPTVLIRLISAKTVYVRPVPILVVAMIAL